MQTSEVVRGPFRLEGGKHQEDSTRRIILALYVSCIQFTYEGLFLSLVQLKIT